jgi:hypothetical protein
MTRTEDRLADALAAVARTVPEETLRPLIVPRSGRPRAAWLAPAAAAVAVMLAVGLAMAVSSGLPGFGRAGGSPGLTGQGQGWHIAGAPPRYYVEADIASDKTVVRSTATGAVTATVPVPYVFNDGSPAIAAASNGTFFVAAFVRGTSDERIYRFRLTGAGQVTGFSQVPGGVLGAGQQVDAMAASPDGSQLAVGINPDNRNYPWQPSDEIAVIHAATGVKTVWRGGMNGLGRSFEVASLSWTGDGHELVFLGQLCVVTMLSSEICSDGRRTAVVRTLDPSSGGGTLDSGQLLLAQSRRFPYIAQALISPDGSTITAAVLTGPVKTSGQISDQTPEVVSVVQISLATGRQLRVLCRRDMGRTATMPTIPDFLALAADGTGQHWMLKAGVSAGFNGWIDSGRLIPVQPADGSIASEAW